MRGEELSAVVLAAGEGSRLAPLTKRRPKPMLPVGSKPLLEHVISAVSEAGIKRIVLVVGYERDRIQTYFGDGDDWGVSLSYTVQDQQLGTAHAVQQAANAVGDEFLVLNGDRLIEPEVIEQVREELIGKETETPESDDAFPEADAVMAVTRSAEPSRYGVVTLEGSDVVEIVEKPRGDSPSEIINAGVYGFRQDVFEAIAQTGQSDSGEYELPTVVNRLAEKGRVQAVRYDGRWLDVSQLWDLLTVTGQVLDDGHGQLSGTVEEGAQVSNLVHLDETATVAKNAVVGRGTTLAENVRIGPNATVERSVVFPDATIRAGAVVRNSIIGANVTVGENVTIPKGKATVVVEGTVHEDVQFGGVIGDNTHLGGGSVLEPGTIIGDSVTLAPGTTVRGTVDDNVEVRNG